MSVLGQYSSTFPYFIYGLLKYVLIKSIRIHFPFIVGVGHVEEDSGCRAYTESGAGQRRQRRTWNFYHGKTLVELSVIPINVPKYILKELNEHL